MTYQDYQAEDFASDESFQNYATGRVGEDQKFWENWIDQNSNKLEEIQIAKNIIQSISLDVTEKETKMALNNLRNQIELEGKIIPISKRKNYFRIGIAMSIIALLLSGLFLFQNKHTPEWTLVKTDFSELNKITLPDGSQLSLNSNSSVRYDQNWTNKTNREVWLKGEAYFDITKTPTIGTQQFIVHTKDADIEVLGTSFNVYHRNDFLEVALETGRVDFQINDTGQSLQMKPNDVIRLNENHEIEKLNNVDIKLFTSWREYKLKLKKTPMIKVINAIQDNFGYEVVVKNKSILNRKLTATIPIKDVDILLEALREIYQLKIKKENGKIIIE